MMISTGESHTNDEKRNQKETAQALVEEGKGVLYNRNEELVRKYFYFSILKRTFITHTLVGTTTPERRIR